MPQSLRQRWMLLPGNSPCLGGPRSHGSNVPTMQQNPQRSTIHMGQGPHRTPIPSQASEEPDEAHPPAPLS